MKIYVLLHKNRPFLRKKSYKLGEFVKLYDFYPKKERIFTNYEAIFS